MNKKSVFVTGASGFVGANLVRALLKKKYKVSILNRTKNISWRLKDIQHDLYIYNADLTNYNSLHKAIQKSQPNYIFHLATYGAYPFQTKWEKVINVNIEGTKNLLKASLDIPYTHFINTGSSSEYGIKNKPMKETDFCNPISYYGATKLATTNLCKVFSEMNKKSIATYRLFSVYGPYEEPTRFLPTITKSLREQQPIQLTSGKQRRDFIYIDDVINAYLKILTIKKQFNGEVFNIGTGKEYTNDEVVEKLFKVTQKQTQINKGHYPKRLWDAPHWVADMSHTKKHLSWKPIYTLEKGLQNNYSWFSKNSNYYA